MSASAVTQAEKAGAAPYSRALLSVYDTVVLRWSNTLAWRCPSERPLAHYNSHRWTAPRHRPRNRLEPPPRHLPHPEPGGGAARSQSEHPADDHRTAHRPRHHRGRAHRQHPGPTSLDIGVFDSVAANFVLHCVPGTWAEKARAFGHIAQIMADDGVFFGSTILDTGRSRCSTTAATTSTGCIRLWSPRSGRSRSPSSAPSRPSPPASLGAWAADTARGNAGPNTSGPARTHTPLRLIPILPADREEPQCRHPNPTTRRSSA